MKKYVVKDYVTANFGTLGGWHIEKYDTLEEAKAHAGKFSFIEEIEEEEEKK